MTELTKSVPTLAATLLQRAPLTTGVSQLQPAASTSGTVITTAASAASAAVSSSGVTITKIPATKLPATKPATTVEGLSNLTKQVPSVKQTNIVLLQSAANTNGGPQKTKFNPPPPPPLIPTIPPAAGTSTEHSYASQPQVANGTGAEIKKPEPKKTEGPTKSSSESSSEDSSSDSSSAEESEKDDAAKPVTVVPQVPGPSGLSRRGRPRGRPRLGTSTPQPSKTAKQNAAAAKDQKSRTTPRKKSGRVAKPAVMFSPEVAGGKAALPKRRGRGCGGCPGCLRDDCGKCNYCKDKTKFGGPGRKKQRCALRICSNFVKALHGKARLADMPSSEVAVIPVTKLTSTPKFDEIIEQLRLNRTTNIPPVIDKDSLPSFPTTTVTPQTTSIIISKPQPLQSTPAALATVAASETKIVGPVTPPTVTSSKVATPVITMAATTTSTPATTATTAVVSPETKTSEIALRTRRKQQQQVKEKEKEKEEKREDAASSGEEKVKCLMCGRERKPSLMRSNQFCTQRCINAWAEKNSKEVAPVSAEVSEPMEVDKQVPSQPQPKKLPRALKNLQIDMTWDRRIAVESRSTQSAAVAAATAKPTTTTTPTPTATTAANKRPTASTGVQPTPTKKAKDNEVATAGTKRPAQQQQQPVQGQKKMKEGNQDKFVSFNLAIPTSTVDPISAPPLSRTVPPPAISIVPLDQLTALGTALFTHQQQQQKAKKEEAAPKTNVKVPTGLPVDVRSWTIAQVVKFFESTSDCKDYAAVFREQEVDGTALLLLTHESLVKCLGIKLGRALKIMVHVEELQKLYA